MPVVARLNQYGTLIASEFDEFSPNKVTVTNTGIFYSAEFIENVDVNYSNIYSAYDVTNDLVAEPLVGTGNTYTSGELTTIAYPAYDVTTSEFASPLYGPGEATYIRYTIHNKCIVYNEIDEVSAIN
jgi:hypothetical protein